MSVEACSSPNSMFSGEEQVRSPAKTSGWESVVLKVWSYKELSTPDTYRNRQQQAAVKEPATTTFPSATGSWMINSK